MSKRNYNVFFNAHTVSGIVISVALYIIFFAGAFALFKNEITTWQEGEYVEISDRKDIDYDRILSKLDTTYTLLGRDLKLYLHKEPNKVYVYLLASKDSLASEAAKTSQYFSVNINNLAQKTYAENYSLGEFLYRLHFFHQIPTIGMYLAGFIALFFLFAIVTGVIVHWKKMVSNFYDFNPKKSLKRVWSDAHTTLGIIGLPFQFVYAITGAYFALTLLVLLPANIVYKGDQVKLMEELRPERTAVDWISTSTQDIPSYNNFVQKSDSLIPNFHPHMGYIKNYGGVNMQYILTGNISDKQSFTGSTRFVYDHVSKDLIIKKHPDTFSYIEDVQAVVTKLHFAEYGGNYVKTIYFILAFITCFVIISGILIWVESRNKKTMTIDQRLYTAKIGHLFISICLSMFPVTALAFLFVKCTQGYFNDGQTAIYLFYFITWFLMSLYFRYKRDNYKTNKSTLLLGAILGFLIPIINGILSNNWIWNTFKDKQFDILLVDLLWIMIATTALITYFKIRPKVKEQSSFSKHPINYKSINQQRKVEHLQNKKRQQIDTTNLKNQLPMTLKITLLWFFSAFGWIVHHVYGLFNIYYNENLMMDGATGDAPLEHHLYRIAFEGLCLLFAVLTIEVSTKVFKEVSFFVAILAGLYNLYHLVSSLIYDLSNISELFILILMCIASSFLVKNLAVWRKEVRAFN